MSLSSPSEPRGNASPSKIPTGSSSSPLIDESSSKCCTLILANGDERTCSCHVLIQASRYFHVMLDGDGSFAESLSRRIQLQHLDHRAIHAILDYLHDAHDDDCDDATNYVVTTEFKLWPNFLGWETKDSAALVQALDYLQIACSSDAECNKNEELLECTVQAIHILHDPSIVRQECIAQRWIIVRPPSRNTNTDTTATTYYSIRQIPVGKKKRSWRFWVCYFLCMEIMLQEGERMDQMSFTERLENVNGSNGGAVALRRELIEYGLMEREGDGSAYWRPPYTINLLRDRIKGLPRRVM